MRYPIALALYLATGALLTAQTSPSAAETTPSLTLSGYVDTYYAHFTDSLGPNVLQQYTTVSPRDRRIGLNVAQLGAHYAAERIRGNVTLHYGDIAEATWSGTFSPVQEANVGFRLTEGWWVDAGFFRTHIGTESFLPKDNWLSSTAVATYNEPFYQAGARLQYSDERLTGELWVTNGYNFFLDVNSAKSVGILLNYAFSERTSLTYTNLFGRESPDGVAPTQFRTYQNLYLQTALSDRFELLVGGDFGTQSNSTLTDSTRAATMFNALLTLRYAVSPQLFLTGRYEIYDDPDGFISGTLVNRRGRREGLQLQGYTLGLEYRPAPNAYLRPEVRYLRTADSLPIFNNDFDQTNRWEAMVTMGFYFDGVSLWP